MKANYVLYSDGSFKCIIFSSISAFCLAQLATAAAMSLMATASMLAACANLSIFLKLKADDDFRILSKLKTEEIEGQIFWNSLDASAARKKK